jgi:hypothetical protein
MKPIQVGIISDTHGLLRPEAVAALNGSEFILHAGDVGGPDILPQLRRIAPVTAVRGNVDEGPWADPLREWETIALAGQRIHLRHILAEVDAEVVAEGIGVVVTGHSHRPLIERVDGVLFVNPGSAGPRRFRLPVTVALLELADGEIGARIVTLAAGRQD